MRLAMLIFEDILSWPLLFFFCQMQSGSEPWDDYYDDYDYNVEYGSDYDWQREGEEQNDYPYQDEQ